jgi:PGF-pre-PGF domain-containing protein
MALPLSPNRSILVIAILVSVSASLIITPLLASPTAAQPAPPHRIYGTVSTQAGEPIAGATVEVQYEGSVIATDTTDRDGYYDLEVQNPDAEATEKQLTVSVRSRSTTLTFAPASATELDLTVSGQQTTTPTAAPTTATDTGDAGGSANSGGQSGAQSADVTTAPPTQEVAESLRSGQATVTLDESSKVHTVSVQMEARQQGQLRVQQVTTLPANVPDPASHSVDTLSIEAPASQANASAEVRVELTRAALPAGATPKDLRVQRYNDATGQWEPLNTSVQQATDETVLLTAQTPGFSLFAVTAQTPQSTAPTDSPTAQTTSPVASATPAGSTATTGSEESTTSSPGFGGVVTTLAMLIIVFGCRVLTRS